MNDAILRKIRNEPRSCRTHKKKSTWTSKNVSWDGTGGTEGQHLSSGPPPESVTVYEQQCEVECDFTFDLFFSTPPPGAHFSSRALFKAPCAEKGKRCRLSSILHEGQMRLDEWMNKWTPLLDILLSLPIVLWPLLSSVFLLLCSTIGTIVSIGVICCFWGGPLAVTQGASLEICPSWFKADSHSTWAFIICYSVLTFVHRWPFTWPCSCTATRMETWDRDGFAN